MTTRYLIAALAATVLLIAGCSSASEAAPESTDTPTPRTYDIHDCTALMERNYEEDNAYDASGDPECADLTDDEYKDVLTDVLKDHVGDFFDQAAREAAWDSAWEKTSTAQQDKVCELLDTYGVTFAAWMVRDEVDPDVIPDPDEWLQYINDNKCGDL